MTNMRSILLAALMAAVPLITFAETDYVAKEELDAIREGRNNNYQIKTLRVSTNATIGGTLSVGGTITQGGTAITASSAELNILDGVTATAAELNAADVTASTNRLAPGFLYTVKGGYSFSAGSNLMTNQTLGITIPDNAIVMMGLIDVTTPLISSNNNGTLAIDLRGGANILTAIDADTIAATHTNTTDIRIESPGTWIKTTSNTEVVIETATGHVTNGAFDVILFYAVGR